MLKFLFSTLQTFRPATLLKGDSYTRASFWEICGIFKNTYFEKYFWTTDSGKMSETINKVFRFIWQSGCLSQQSPSRQIKWTYIIHSYIGAQLHCVKSIQIRNFFWFVFSCIWMNFRIQSECRKMRTRKNSVFGHFSHNGFLLKWFNNLYHCSSHYKLFIRTLV